MAEAAARSSFLGPALVGSCAVLLLVERWEVTPQVDDAYISYRYAANWLAGHGLVFNVGELVEGYTNPLWVVLVAIGLLLGFEADAVGHVLGLISGVAALVATGAYARALAPGLPTSVAGAAPLLLLASAPFVRWTTAGLETTLFAALVTAALAAATAARLGWAAVILGFATLARPEGLLVAALVFAFAIARHRDAMPAVPVVAYLIGLVGLTVGRLVYYGDFVPNTFHAKVGGVPLSWGVYYLEAFLRDGPALLLPAVGFAAWRLPAARVGAAVALVFALYVVGVGGDLLGESRFLVPLLPVLAALAVVGAGSAFARGRAVGGVVAASVVAAGLLSWIGPGGPPGDGTKRARVLARAARSDRLFEVAGRERALLLRARGDREALVATGAIGSFGYHSELPIVDILGLVDATIARTPVPRADSQRGFPGHQRSNADYVLSREPDYLLIRERGTPGSGRLRAVADLWAHPDLERHYVWDAELRAYRRRGGPR